MANLPSYNPLPPMGPLPSHNPAPNAYNLATPGAAPQDQGQTVIEQLLAKLKGDENPVTQGLANAGQVAGGLANDERLNRLSKGNLTQNYDQLMLQAQTGRNQNEGDALKKMAITGYLKSGGFKGGPTSLSINGQTRTLPTFGSAPRPASASQVSAAGTLEDMLKQRLASGGSYLPQDLGGYANPGMVENASRYGGTVASGLGVINDMMNTGSNKGNVMNAVGSGLKKVGGGIISGLKKIF